MKTEQLPLASFTTAALILCAVAWLPALAQAGMVITPSPGYGISWDGNDGDFFSAANPANAPANLATSTGVTAFGSSAYGGAHTIAHANDAQYGNSFSWLANPGDATPYIGLNLVRSQPLTSLAFGRDNGNSVIPPEPNPQLTDRALGTYTLQYTRTATPGTGTAETGNPSTGWATFGTLNYQSNDDAVVGGAFTSYYRHQFSISQGGQPVQATGIQIKPSTNERCIDEIELSAAAGPTPPAAASSLKAWLRGDLGIVTKADGSIQTWGDQSGLKNDTVNPPGGTPTPVDNAIAGKAAARFTPSQWLNLPFTGTALDIANSDYEIFVVAKSGGTGGPEFLTAAGSGQLGHYELHLDGGIGARFIPSLGAGDRYADFGPAGVFTDNKPHVYSIRVEGNTGYVRVDGQQSADTVAAAQSAVNNYITLGVRGDASYPFSGDMGEVLVYKGALTPSQRSQVEQYLFGRYSIPNFALVQVGGGPVQYNAAAASRGGVAFAKDLINNGGYGAHQIDHLNDGLYGNDNSWIGNSAWTFAGVAFSEASTIDAIAFGRDNGGTETTGGPLNDGQLVDRYIGEYVLQYTTADRASLLANPAAVTWNTIRVFDYSATMPDSTGYLRHLYQFDPIPGATGVRIMVSNGGTAIDEIEVEAIPEPMTLATLLLASSGLAGYLRRRRA